MAHSESAWHMMGVDAVRRVLATHPEHGLTHEEVRRRSHSGHKGREHVYGGWRHALLAVRNDPSVLFLITLCVFGGILSIFTHETYVELLLLVCILVGSVYIGVRSNRAFCGVQNAIHDARAYSAVVVRDGHKETVSADSLVEGDVVFLTEGCRVPRDMRLVKSHTLLVEESGSEGYRTVHKACDVVLGVGNASSYKNMVYEGAAVRGGSGVGVVVRAPYREHEVSEKGEEWGYVPASFRRALLYAFPALIIGVMSVSCIMYARGEHAIYVALLGVALLLAGFPFMTTHLLRASRIGGASALLHAGSLVTRPETIEQVGLTTVVLTDKTGMLTRGDMELTAIWSLEGLRSGQYDVSGDNRTILSFGVLQSDTYVEERDSTPASLSVEGRPIERALAFEGLRVGFPKESLLLEYPLLDRLSFTPERRFGATLHHDPHHATQRLVILGAPETLLSASETAYLHGTRERMSPEMREDFYEKVREESRAGKRVLAVAYREVTWHEIPADSSAILEARVVFGGLVVFNDPLQSDVQHAIHDASLMGVRALLLTGDAPETARMTARATGVARVCEERVIRGGEIDEWNDRELFTYLAHTNVVAEALPAHKQRIATVLAHNGEVVAMVGETVSDIPALRCVQVGIAQSTSGEAVKQASALVLTNDHLRTIVDAIRVGRHTAQNLRRSVAYTTPALFSGTVLLFGASIAGFPLPLQPAHLLFVAFLWVCIVAFVHAGFLRDRNTSLPTRTHTIFTRVRARREFLRELFLLSVTGGILLLLLYAVLLLSMASVSIEVIRTFMCSALFLCTLAGAFFMDSRILLFPRGR